VGNHRRYGKGTPLKCPELFEPNLAYRPVQEEAVDPAIVPVDAEILHIFEPFDVVFVFGRVVEFVRPCMRIDTVKQNRYAVSD